MCVEEPLKGAKTQKEELSKSMLNNDWVEPRLERMNFLHVEEPLRGIKTPGEELPKRARKNHWQNWRLKNRGTKTQTEERSGQACSQAQLTHFQNVFWTKNNHGVAKH